MCFEPSVYEVMMLSLGFAGTMLRSAMLNEEEVHETALQLICDCKRFEFTRMSKFGEDPITIDHLMRFISLTKEKELSIQLDFVGDCDL